MWSRTAKCRLYDGVLEARGLDLGEKIELSGS